MLGKIGSPSRTRTYDLAINSRVPKTAFSSAFQLDEITRVFLNVKIRAVLTNGLRRFWKTDCGAGNGQGGLPTFLALPAVTTGGANG